MTENNFRRNNHYVSCGYLKRWESSRKKVWTYRTLVSHEKVPMWKESSLKGVAYHSHLYTRIASGQESDEIEKLFDREYETPAEEAIRKATSNECLTPSDWKKLVRFLAAQDVRTPARLLENLQRWRKTLPNLLENTLHKAVHKLENAKSGDTQLKKNDSSLAEYLPIRITSEIKPCQEFGEVKAETAAGRGLWLFSIRSLLTSTANILHQHRWTILSPPKEVKGVKSPLDCIR